MQCYSRVENFFRTFFHWSTVRKAYFFAIVNIYTLCNRIHAMCPTFYVCWFDRIIHLLWLRSFFFTSPSLCSPHCIISQWTGQLSWLCLVYLLLTSRLYSNCINFFRFFFLWNIKCKPELKNYLFWFAPNIIDNHACVSKTHTHAKKTTIRITRFPYFCIWHGLFCVP